MQYLAKHSRTSGRNWLDCLYFVLFSGIFVMAADGQSVAPVLNAEIDESHSKFNQASELNQAFDAVTDRTLALGAEELPAYFQLLDRTRDFAMPTADNTLLEQSTLSECLAEPAKKRGRCVQFLLKIDRVLEYDTQIPGADEAHLYEVWGTTESLPNHLVVCVARSLPPTIDVDRPAGALVIATGLFFKLQGYIPRSSDERSPPSVAPLLMAQLSPAAPKLAAFAQTDDWRRLTVILVVAASCAYSLSRLTRRIIGSSRPNKSPARPELSRLDAWLSEATPRPLSYDHNTLAIHDAIPTSHAT